tara:strand:+ start:2280 stop:2621 length:342 start_codon:yes stop_codon:yes gene_type:complete
MEEKKAQVTDATLRHRIQADIFYLLQTTKSQMPSKTQNAQSKKKPAPPRGNMRRNPPQRKADNRMVSAWVDKKVAHQIKLEAAKLNMNQSDFIRFVINQALEDDKLKPPMKDL